MLSRTRALETVPRPSREALSVLREFEADEARRVDAHDATRIVKTEVKRLETFISELQTTVSEREKEIAGVNECLTQHTQRIDALQKSMKLQGENSFDFFFLAMAHWQLGHEDEARTWYDQAVEWMQKNKPDDAELRRFRAEAEELLRVPVAAPKPETSGG